MHADLWLCRLTSVQGKGLYDLFYDKFAPKQEDTQDNGESIVY